MATDIIARALAANGGGGGTTDAYTKAETNALLATKANANETYTKTEVDAELDTKLDVDMSNIGEDGIAKVKEIIQPELDKKADKITIEAVTSDANVVTVPENVKDFGMISMVGGKTVKTKNLIPFPYYSESDIEPVNGIKRVINPDGTITFSGTSTSNTTNFFCAYSLSLRAGTYTLSGCPDLSGLQIRMKVGSTNYDINANETKTITLDGNTTGVQIYPRVTKADVVCNNVIFKPMLEEGSEATKYEPYFEGLRNAPVEKIMVKCANLWDGKFYDLVADLNNSFKIIDDNDTSYSAIIPCKPNATYTVSKIGGSRFRIYTTSEFPKVNDYPIRQVVNNNALTEYTFKTSANENYIMLYAGRNTDVVSEIKVVDSSIKEISLTNLVANLPDYGCSAGDVYNYVDFETMIYHHRCEINADGSDTEVLSTEELIPIPDIFTIIPVEANGTIEFVNEHNLDVPNTVKYQKGAE